MDGSAKQIIRMSENLGLTAEEVVKIKAAIEGDNDSAAGPGSYNEQ